MNKKKIAAILLLILLIVYNKSNDNIVVAQAPVLPSYAIMGIMSLMPSDSVDNADNELTQECDGKGRLSLDGGTSFIDCPGCSKCQSSNNTGQASLSTYSEEPTIKPVTEPIVEQDVKPEGWPNHKEALAEKIVDIKVNVPDVVIEGESAIQSEMCDCDITGFCTCVNCNCPGCPSNKNAVSTEPPPVSVAKTNIPVVDTDPIITFGNKFLANGLSNRIINVTNTKTCIFCIKSHRDIITDHLDTDVYIQKGWKHSNGKDGDAHLQVVDSGDSEQLDDFQKLLSYARKMSMKSAKSNGPVFSGKEIPLWIIVKNGKYAGYYQGELHFDKFNELLTKGI